MAMDFRFP